MSLPTRRTAKNDRPWGERRTLAVILAALLLTAAGCAGDAAIEPSRTPIVEGLLGAWSRLQGSQQGADLVCLGEDHGSPADAALREALVTDPRFADTVDQIVVEWASPIHQALLDRFVVDGEAMTRGALAPVWQDAGRGVVWQLPKYERFLRVVQQRNRTLPADRRIRVLGGATPIPWGDVETAEDLRPWRNRQHHLMALLADLLRTPDSKTLVLFGAKHCEKQGSGAVARLHGSYSDRIFSAFAFNSPAGDAEGRQHLGLDDRPAWIPITDTPYAALPVGGAFFEGHAFSGATFGDLLDAVVVHGVLAAEPEYLDEDALDPDFRRELARRDRLWREVHALGHTAGASGS